MGVTRTSPVKIIALSIFGVVALYVLSIGPVCRFTARNGNPLPAVVQFYYPLRQVHDAVPVLGYSLEWYLDLWIKPLGPISN